jgi:trehalose 6-phosphate synthase
VRLLLPDFCLISGSGRSHKLISESREIKAAAFPISINYAEFSEAAASDEVERMAWLFHEKFKEQQIVFSLDRLDSTKGIPYRLEAIRMLLKIYPELHEKITFIQVVIPSRVEIPEYQELKQKIDRLVSDINSQYTKENWVPIQYLFRSLSHEELLMHYRAAEVCLVTPIKDGMNLVCKEYIASNSTASGVLILSEFAGAASQLYKEALLVNPYDVEGVCNAIHRALTMPEKERKGRMTKMKRLVRRQDIFHWVENFLNAAFAKELHDFPLITDYIPKPPRDPDSSLNHT